MPRPMAVDRCRWACCGGQHLIHRQPQSRVGIGDRRRPCGRHGDLADQPGEQLARVWRPGVFRCWMFAHLLCPAIQASASIRRQCLKNQGQFSIPSSGRRATLAKTGRWQKRAGLSDRRLDPPASACACETGRANTSVMPGNCVSTTAIMPSDGAGMPETTAQADVQSAGDRTDWVGHNPGWRIAHQSTLQTDPRTGPKPLSCMMRAA